MCLGKQHWGIITFLQKQTRKNNALEITVAVLSAAAFLTRA